MTGPSATGQFPRLFSPLKIGSFTVCNRIMSTAHFTGFGRDGVPSERHIDYWVSKAKGGIGLIMTEVQPVHPSSGTSDAMILAYRDDCIEPFLRLVEAVHEHGARIVAQLWHAGNTGSSQYDGLASWAPSPVPSMLYGETPHEMTVEEIREVVEGFAAAAVRMKEAGLDGVEIHGGYCLRHPKMASAVVPAYNGSAPTRVPMVFPQPVKWEGGRLVAMAGRTKVRQTGVPRH